MLLPCLLLTLGPAPAAPPPVREYAVVVHADVPVKNVTSAELRELLLADRLTWPGKKKVTAYLVLPGRGLDERAFLLSEVYRMSEKELGKHWVEKIYRQEITARPKELPNVTLMFRLVETKPGALAVIETTHLPEDGRFRTLTVDGLAPGAEGYPLRWRGPEETSAVPAAQLAAGPSPAVPAGFQQEDDALGELRDQLADVQLQLALGDQDTSLLDGPDLSLRGFGHVQFDGTSTDTNDSDSFALGGLDLFLTSQLADDVSFLNETVFEPNDANEYTLDVERLVLKWTHSDALNVQVGRVHTTLGVWNEAYHHGEWLQTSIGRPMVLGFEDDGGVLPVHLVGLVVKGEQDAGPGKLDYTLELGNGRGATQDPPQIIGDANDAKAVNLALGYSPEGAPGLRFGGGVYVDTLPANTAAGAGPLHGELDETITSLFGRYESSGWDLLAEYFSIRHEGGAGGDATSEGYYVQASRRVGDVTPYVRFDSLAPDDADTYFTFLDDRDRLAAGVRWDWREWVALKLQVETTDIDLAAGGSDSEDRVLGQVSFAF